MNKITYYKNSNNRGPFEEYVNKLEVGASKNNKDSIRKLRKVNYYLQMLAEDGTQWGMPHVRHLEGILWELRFLKNERIFFAKSNDGNYLILHHFVKKSQNTPQRELEKARREIADAIKRGIWEYE